MSDQPVTDDLAGLRALAEAATPGPWVADPSPWRPPSWAEEWGYRKIDAPLGDGIARRIASTDGAAKDSESDQAHVANAAYIAAANPTVVLALIADLTAARAAIGRVYALPILNPDRDGLTLEESIRANGWNDAIEAVRSYIEATR